MFDCSKHSKKSTAQSLGELMSGAQSLGLTLTGSCCSWSAIYCISLRVGPYIGPSVIESLFDQWGAPLEFFFTFIVRLANGGGASIGPKALLLVFSQWGACAID